MAADAFNTPAVLNRLKALADAVPSVATPKIGAPLDWTVQVSAAVAMAGQSVGVEENGFLARESRFLVTFGYRIQQGATEPAELALAAIVDDFLRRAVGDTVLRGLLIGLHVSAEVSDTVDYQIFAGQEVRLYACTVRGTQLALPLETP